MPKPKRFATRRDYLLAYPKRQMVISARQRAKRDGVPFDLTDSDFEIPKTCPVFNLPFEPGSRHNHRQAPTLDRIRPELGYVKGNVRVISHRANMLRGNASLQELRSLVQFLEAAV